MFSDRLPPPPETYGTDPAVSPRARFTIGTADVPVIEVCVPAEMLATTPVAFTIGAVAVPVIETFVPAETPLTRAMATHVPGVPPAEQYHPSVATIVD